MSLRGSFVLSGHRRSQVVVGRKGSAKSTVFGSELILAVHVLYTTNLRPTSFFPRHSCPLQQNARLDEKQSSVAVVTALQN